ncbi:methyltransferase [Naumannella sp. ID2617S]|uniref:MFS transporter n=1 Tax=Enemella dayhoffiae TaxID=2016507 RepID=A0A255H8C5_9ACTN|nr:methyltransferase [Enemella dayhoffiae]NNG18145.1 methyltransferase [Naumannella sp. ID2617S]OYO23930.1 MFS transporter [Enemella dayhoffiae]
MSEHYFHTPEGPLRRREVTATIFDTDYRFATANGVFSSDGLDLGTQVLLRTFAAPTEAHRLLDLGCGWGPIAVALADQCPGAVVDAVDTNERALSLCAENAATAGVADRVRTLLPDQADPEARYDEIWSNPPIRIGKEALHALLLTWLDRLTEHGVARLVVGRNLGADSLQRWLDEQGWACHRVASAKGFRVFTVTG